MDSRWWVSHLQTRSRSAPRSHLSSNEPQKKGAVIDRADRLRLIIKLSIAAAIVFAGLAFLMWIASGSGAR